MIKGNSMKNLTIILTTLFLLTSLNPTLADDFIPLSDSSSSEIKQSSINLTLSDNQIINRDSYYTLNACTTINPSRNLLYLTKRISFSYCYPTWVVWNFTVPPDWVPGTDMYLDLNWFTMDNSVLGQVSYKTSTTWKLYYKLINTGDKVLSSFDNSIPTNLDQAVINLVDVLNTFKTVSYTTQTPLQYNFLTSTGSNLVIKSEDLTPNKSVVLVLYRDVLSNEDKVYPAINLHSANIIYSKKQVK
jgi:hypothetical protein